MDLWIKGLVKKPTPRFPPPANHPKIQLSSQPLIFYV